METFAGINFPPAEPAAGPGAEHPDSIPNPEESSGRTQDTHAQKQSRLNPAATDSDKTRRESGGEEGGRLIVSRRSYLQLFFPFSTYRLYTTSRRFALWKRSCRFEPIAAGLFGEQPIKRAGRCSVGVSSGVHGGAGRSQDGTRGGPVGLPSLATSLMRFFFFKPKMKL